MAKGIPELPISPTYCHPLCPQSGWNAEGVHSVLFPLTQISNVHEAAGIRVEARIDALKHDVASYRALVVETSVESAVEGGVSGGAKQLKAGGSLVMQQWVEYSRWENS